MIYKAEYDPSMSAVALKVRIAAKALVENNLTEIAKAQKALLEMLGGDKQAIHKAIDSVIITSSTVPLESHCLYCGRQLSEHVDQKCLFDSTFYAECPKPLPPKVMDFLRLDQKLNAIKMLREYTGMGLKDAKDLVESEALRHNWKPTPITEPSK